LINPLPALLADDHVQVEQATTVRTDGIVDVLDPCEVLSVFSPVLLEALPFQGMQGIERLPDRGQILVLEDDHELPVAGTAALHHRPLA